MYFKTDLRDGVFVLAPSRTEYRRAASVVCEKLRQAGCNDVEWASDTLTNTGGKPVIALGNMMDNAFLRRCYFQFYDLTDYAWPGVGGYTIRTLCHTFSPVDPGVVLGVSNAADLDLVVQAFCDEIDTKGVVLPFLHRVQLGVGAQLYLDVAEPFLRPPDEPWENMGGSGDWDYMMLIARMGMAAVKTGIEDLIPVFVNEILRFAQVRFFVRTREDPIMMHGFLRHMLFPFAMLEHHSAISEAQRVGVRDVFLALFRSTEGAKNPGLLGDVEHWRVRQNHGTRSALDLYCGGRYFFEVHGLDEAKEWMDLAHRFFEPQLKSNKPVCDSWGHQWNASLYNTADYALMAGLDDYFSTSAYLEGVDRAMMAHSGLDRVPLLYLLMASVVTEQTDYLALCGNEDDLIARSVLALGSDEPGRAWLIGQEATVSDRLVGLQVAPLSRIFYNSIEAYPNYAPEGIYHQNVPFENTFDKISFRSGWHKDDDYLLLDGISGGSHSYQDGHCIVAFTSGGKSWLGGPQYGMWSTGSVREYCGVNVVCDGKGPGGESRYAQLDEVFRSDTLQVSSTTMTYLGQSVWRRHIIYHVSGFFLVVDEVEALVVGEFLIDGCWNVMGDVTGGDGHLLSKQDEAVLHMRHCGTAVQSVTDIEKNGERVCSRWSQRVLKNLDVGLCVRFATLFGTKDEVRDLNLSAVDGVYCVGDVLTVNFGSSGIQFEDDVLTLTGGDCSKVSDSVFHIAADRLEPVWHCAVDQPVTTMASTERLVYVGDAGGCVTALSMNGEVQQVFEANDSIRAVAPLPDGELVVGGDDAFVRVFDKTGVERWAYEIEWQPMSWEYWTRLHCGIVSLDVGDVDGDGEIEIVVGCADRHVYCLSAQGQLRWRSACEWGVPVCLSLASVEAVGGLQVLVGMAEPAIHGWCRVYGADGRYIRAFQRPDIVSWSIPSWMQVLRTADLTGDGRPEVLTGLDTNHRQLVVYGGEGNILWDADLGGVVQALEVDSGKILAGTRSGFVQCFDVDGQRRWHCFLDAPIVGVAPGQVQSLVVRKDGAVFQLDENGEVRFARMGNNLIHSDVCFLPSVGLVVGDIGGRVALYGDL